MRKASIGKNEKIKDSLSRTRERRRSQTLKTYTVKVDEKHLNKDQKEYFKMVFVEGKWFYNYLLQQEEPLKSVHLTKQTFVIVKNKDGNLEKRELNYLTSQIKLSLYNRIQGAIKALSVLKKNKIQEVGKLKFKPECKSLEYIQYNISWSIKGFQRIKLQGLKKTFKVFGLKQLKDYEEISNCKLVKRSSGLYLQISTFKQKEERAFTNKVVGLDFGIKDSIITSEGDKFNIKFPETKKLKRLQLHESRKKKGSKNKFKIRNKINKEYEKIKNSKSDATNKLISKLVKENNLIAIQDEMIKSWHSGLFGKQVQMGCLGMIKAKLKSFENTYVIDRKEPTTKMCFCCKTKTKLVLADRVFSCSSCGYTEDRDIKSAKTVLFFALESLKNKSNLSGTDLYTCGEDVRLGIDLIDSKLSSMKEEAQAFRLG